MVVPWEPPWEGRCKAEAHPEVEGGAVGEAHALDPAVAALDLRVPAVLCVMGHLVGQVLPEAQPLGVNTHPHLRTVTVTMSPAWLL